MSREAHTATTIFTTISSVIGGVTKAVSAKPIYLSTHHNKMLYCAIEEGFGYTLKEKIERLKADHPNLFLTDRVPENLGDYQFVFIDSVSKAGMDITEIDRLHKSFPEVSFILIYHTTKE